MFQPGTTWIQYEDGVAKRMSVCAMFSRGRSAPHFGGSCVDGRSRRLLAFALGSTQLESTTISHTSLHPDPISRASVLHSRDGSEILPSPPPYYFSDRLRLSFAATT
jgi:hypothetical protein